jgi:hypothetical protein
MLRMDEHSCCGETGFIAVADNGGDGVDYVECGQNHPAFKDAMSVDELIDTVGKQTGITSDFFKH